MPEDRKSIGDVLDNLGIALRLEPGDLVDSALVIAKVIEDDGSVRLSLCCSDGLDWITRIGMLRAAEALEMRTDDA